MYMKLKIQTGKCSDAGTVNDTKGKNICKKSAIKTIIRGEIKTILGNCETGKVLLVLLCPSLYFVITISNF